MSARRRMVIAAAIALLVVGTGIAVAFVRHRGGPVAARIPGLTVDARAPEGVRIRVQVLNATSTRGLGRRAALHLRDRRFDVVDVANAPERRDSTLVLDRSNHPEWARLVARAMGGARVEARPDSSRYLDVTVLVGTAWRPPAEPFYP